MAVHGSGGYAMVSQACPNAALLEIELPGPLDLQSTLECGQAFRWKRVSGLGGQTWYKGVIGPVGVMLRTLGDSRLLVLYEANHVQRDTLTGLVWHYFSLDDDLETIHRYLLEGARPGGGRGNDPIMEQALRHTRGLRILRQEPWECLVSYIISANKNIPAICNTVEYLSSTLGTPAGLGEYTFPSPQALLEASLECIRQSKCGYRAPYIIDAASKVRSNQVDLGALWHLPTAEARRHLMEIKGVGPKVADCVLLFGYHRLDVFPVDVWIARCMSVFYLDRAGITPKTAREEGCKRFGAYAGYAQQILFHYTRNVLKGQV
ncbi:MAG TPA: DNA glycosylase [Bacillota bacterium]|nr:DNA glycosylase [Bacillota bacterium]